MVRKMLHFIIIISIFRLLFLNMPFTLICWLLCRLLCSSNLKKASAQPWRLKAFTVLNLKKILTVRCLRNLLLLRWLQLLSMMSLPPKKHQQNHQNMIHMILMCQFGYGIFSKAGQNKNTHWKLLKSF